MIGMKNNDMYEVGRALEAKQRKMYYQLGAEIENRKSVKFGFNYDANRAHEMALAALTAVEWKSLKAARIVYAIAMA